METPRISDLLQPYLPEPLSAEQLALVQDYLDLLVRWNAKMNLTAVRTPEEMVTRHFGESLFAAAHLVAGSPNEVTPQTAIDLGSGAGFPGMPLAIYAPQVAVTLIESHNKKSIFLNEVVRMLSLKNVTVISDRGESLAGEAKANLVTMRAVEKFADSATLAATFLQSEGRLALLISAAQADQARRTLPSLAWQDPIAIPGSHTRVLLIGKAHVE